VDHVLKRAVRFFRWEEVTGNATGISLQRTVSLMQLLKPGFIVGYRFLSYLCSRQQPWSMAWELQHLHLLWLFFTTVALGRVARGSALAFR
jgi:hypothetical protein